MVNFILIILKFKNGSGTTKQLNRKFGAEKGVKGGHQIHSDSAKIEWYRPKQGKLATYN